MERTLQRNPKAKQIDGRELYKEVASSQFKGCNDTELGRALNRTPRYIRMLRQRFAPKPYEVLTAPSDAPDLKKYTEWTAEAFIRFHDDFCTNKVPRHVVPWIQAFIDNPQLLLNVPPRHAKSHYFSVWVPIWLICRDRNVQVMLASKTGHFAEKWSREIAGNFESNQALIDTFGRFTPEQKGDFPWRPGMGEMMVQGRTRDRKGAQLSIQSRGGGQHVLGMEADFIIVDDVTDRKISENETTRENLKEWLMGEVFSRLDEAEGNWGQERIVVLGQRVHINDIYGEFASYTYPLGPLKGQKVFNHQNYPAIKDWNPTADTEPEVLWPERWPYERLMRSYALVGGEATFQAMYQQDPMASDTLVFRKEWIDACKDGGRAAGEGVRTHKGDPLVSRVLSIDPGADKFHGVVIADIPYDRDNFRAVILESKSVQAGTLDTLMYEIHRAVELYDIDYLVFEKSGFAKWLYDVPEFRQLKQHFKFISHKTGDNKNATDFGVQSLAWEFEDRHISLPFGDADARRQTGSLEHELLTWGGGRTDDIVMALWFLKFNYKSFKPIPLAQNHHVYGRPKGSWSWYSQQKEELPIRAEYGKRRAYA